LGDVGRTVSIFNDLGEVHLPLHMRACRTASALGPAD